MSTSDTFTKQQWQDQEALHRFQLISPLLQTGLDDAKRLLNNPVSVSLLSGDRKPQIRF